MNRISLEQYFSTLEQIWEDMQKVADLRDGQILFNYFSVFPIAEVQRGTQNDCFYQDENISLFFKAILDNEAWEEYKKSQWYENNPI